MDKQQGDFRAGLEKLLICLSVLCFIGFFVAMAEADQDNEAGNLDTQKNIVQDYQDQIIFIQSEIGKIQQDMDWLSLKIKKMEDFDRFVSKKLYRSIAFKESKIKSLKKLKQRYEQLVKQAIPSFKAIKNKRNLNSGFEKNLRKKILLLGLEDWVELISDSPLRLENRLPVLFTSGSASIAKGYGSFIKNLAALVKGYDVRIIIDGYADTDPIRTKQYHSNFELGAARAAAIVHTLVKHGVKPSVCKIGSTGEYRFDSHKASEWKNLQRHVNIAVFFLGKV